MALNESWTRSSRSGGGGNCVEARHLDGVVHVQDSKDPGPLIALTPQSFRDFLAAVRVGEFDRDR